jgi:predicted RNase H-like nuclease (RuvC/YqgF family)
MTNEDTKHTIDELTGRVRDLEHANAKLRLTNEGLVGMYDRAVESLAEERRERLAMHETHMKARTTLADDLASLTDTLKASTDRYSAKCSELDTAKASFGEQEKKRSVEHAREVHDLERKLDARVDEIDMLEEKLNDAKRDLAAHGAAWKAAHVATLDWATEHARKVGAK